MNLTSKELDSVMHDDIYFALPLSTIKWLNTFNLNASQRLIIERVIGFAIQRPTRALNNLRIRLSTSLISEFTSIKERTVISSIQKLVELGLLSKDGSNQKGTLYTINLSSEIKNLVKPRFKATSIKSIEREENAASVISDSSEITSEQNDVDLLRTKLKLIQNKIKELSPSLPKDFSPKLMLKKCFTFNDEACQAISKLRENESNLIKQIELRTTKINDKRLNEVQTTQPLKRKDSKSPFRFVRAIDSKSLMTRLKNIGLFKSATEQEKYHKEILWAIRFGWYKDFKGTTFHCINHALRLIKDNTWRTPAGYQQNQIEGLISFHKVSV